MSVADALRMLQTGLDPHTIFPCFDTPYSKRSHTNYAASGWETPTIRDIISHRKAQINGIDAIVERLEATLEQFREKREEAIFSMKTHEGFISSVRRLPPEILSRIFLHCLPPEGFVMPCVKTAPLLLTRTCRSWRDVALGTPRLWCSLLVRGSTKQLPQWLEKAKTLPLSMNVTISSYFPESAWREATLSFLQLHNSRLINLTLAFNEADGLDRLFENVPMLERLTLVGHMEQLHWAPAISIVQPQPRLRFLTIDSHSLDPRFFSVLNPGWTNLTHVTIKLRWNQIGVRSSVFTTLLQMCPNLDHFVLSPVVFLQQDVAVSLTHPKLRLLDIDELSWHHTCLDNLTLPNLRRLNLACVTRQVPFFERQVLEGKRNRILNITTPYLDLNKAKKLFSLFNPGWIDLTHLRISFRGSDSVFFHLLELCPYLEDLVVSSIPFGSPDRANSDFPLVPTAYPFLRSLTIIDLQGHIDDLFKTLILPSLSHLDISLRVMRPWRHEKFMEFLFWSKCPLKTLKIKGTGIRIKEWEEFGSFVPTLRRVDIYDCAAVITDVPVYSWVR